MPARRKVNTSTGEILEITPAPTSPPLEAAIASEATSARRWLARPDHISQHAKRFLIGCGGVALVGLSGMLGAFTKGLMEQQTTATAIARSMQTAIPVIRALDVDVDPGRYEGKLVDVVMSITKGGVYKSGKGLYLQEREQGLSLVIFESAFQAFLPEGGEPSQLVARLVGKTVKARGTVRSFGSQQDGSRRLSMVIYAPGLLSEIPER